MRKTLFFIPLLFLGCSVSDTAVKVTEFTKCYVHSVPAPFWVCYQSPFLSVGKVKANVPTRLKQEEAYSLGVSALVNKLEAKTNLFIKRLGLKNVSLKNEIKDFVILNALQGDSWYDKTDKMIYVQVKLDKNEFKNFLFSKFKNIDKKTLESAYDETF
jgi:hypothetical protein